MSPHTSDPGNIPMVDLRAEVAELIEPLTEAVLRVLRSGRFVLGPEVAAFEDEVARYLDVPHAVGVNSGTDALVIGLRALGVGPGDEVVTSPFTFYATVEAIVRVGATPVLVDIAEDSFDVDPFAVEAALTDRTRAILPVHLFGEPAAMQPLLELAHQRDLFVLEDAAQAFGGELSCGPGGNGQHCVTAGAKAGTAGDIGAFSFYPTKNLGAYGDGGLIATRDPVVAERVRALRNHAARPGLRYEHDGVGFNSRLDELQAAILRVKLRLVDSYNRQRRAIANRYGELLSPIEGVAVPADHPGHVYHQYTIRVPSDARDRVVARFEEEGIASSHFYPHFERAWPMEGIRVHGGCPRAAEASGRVLSLPMHPHLTADEQERVAAAVGSAMAS